MKYDDDKPECGRAHHAHVECTQLMVGMDEKLLAVIENNNNNGIRNATKTENISKCRNMRAAYREL